MSSQFLRLFWKECHVQKSLWLVLAFCLVLLQTVIAFADGRLDLAPQVLAVVVVMTACFLMASVALLFAGEEDQGTALLLRQLPMSTDSLFWSKVSAAVTGTLAMIILGALTSLMLLTFRGWRLEFRPEEVASVGFLICFLFVVSLFCSLLCRSLFRSIGLSATFLTVGIALRWTLFENLLIPSLLIVALTAIAILPLPYLWHRGLSSRRTIRGRTKSTEPRSRWFPERVTWLQKTALGPSQLSRTKSVLFWQECRFAIPFAFQCVGIGFVIVFARIVVIPELALMPLFAFLVVMECGLRTFRYDQQKLNGLFWSQRGISPLLIWGVRCVVWLSVMLLVLTALLLLDSPTSAARISEEMQIRLIDLITTLPMQVVRHVPVPALIVPAWLLGGFFISQLCSCWSRKPLVALFLAGILFGTYTALLGYCLWKDIPLNLMAWPVVVVAVLAVIFTRWQWMDRRQSLRIKLLRAVFLALPLLCLWPIKAAWRVLQIPVASEAAVRTPQELGYSQQNASGAWSDHWESLDLAIKPLYSKNTTVASSNVELHPESMQRAMVSIDAILSDGLQYRHLPPRWRLPWAQYPAQPIAEVFIQKAVSLRQDGHAQEALTRLVQACRLLHFLQREATSWPQWNSCTELKLQLMQHIHWVAADDSLSASALENGLNIGAGITDVLTIETLLQNRICVYSQLMTRTGYLWEYYQHLQQRSGEIQYLNDWPVTLIEAGFPERERFRRLLLQTSVPAFRESPTYAGHNLYRWAQTTMPQDSDLMSDPLFTGSIVHSEIPASNPASNPEQTENANQATQIILWLQGYRRRHGEFPERLSELVSDVRTREWTPELQRNSPPDLIRTILSGDAAFQFRYSKTGLGHSYNVTSDSRAKPSIHIRAEQPVLWNRISPPLILPVTADQDLTHHRYLKLDPSRIVYLDGSRIAPPGPTQAVKLVIRDGMHMFVPVESDDQNDDSSAP